MIEFPLERRIGPRLPHLHREKSAALVLADGTETIQLQGSIHIVLGEVVLKVAQRIPDGRLHLSGELDLQ